MNGLRVRQLPWQLPSEVFAAWQSRPHCAWLDSASGAGEGISILAADPVRVICTKGPAEDPFDLVRQALQARSCDNDRPFPTGAAIGYFAYDLKNQLERLPDRAVDDLGLPDAWFGIYDHLLVFDHARQTVWEVGPGDRIASPREGEAGATPTSDGGVATGEGESPACTTVGSPLTRAANDGGPASPSGGEATVEPSLVSNFTHADYLRAVAKAKEYIAAGDIYQVNLAQRFQCSTTAGAAELYQALRRANPGPYCAYLDIGDAQILSSSPECFLKISGREVITRPIKGTRPRAGDPAELLQAPKDNAELLMITDLERNDLGKVCEFGSVHVRELKRVESYATVHHLVSTVAGRLRPEVDHLAALRACFPGGSITGAPKIRAMEIIDELEPHARGVYTGAIGFCGFNGQSHFNIAIRTLVYQQGRLTFHAGGGIVADSEPAAEYEETLAKAQGIINAIDQVRVR